MVDSIISVPTKKEVVFSEVQRLFRTRKTVFCSSFIDLNRSNKFANRSDGPLPIVCHSP